MSMFLGKFTIYPYDIFVQEVSVGEYIILPKVVSGLICIVSVKCSPRSEDEVLEDEIGMDRINMMSSIIYILHCPSLVKVRIHLS